MKYLLFHSRAKDPDGKVLSNFYPCSFVYNDRHFHSVEEAFQCMKFTFSSNPDLYNQVFNDPKLAKSAGSKSGMKKFKCVLNISDWNQNSKRIMKEIMSARYDSDTLFRNILNRCKNENIMLYHFERSGAKSFWGGCFKDGTFVGNNALGKIILNVFPL